MLYFSGIASPQERRALEQAGVRHALVDPTDVPHLPTGCISRVLDSGAYRAAKRGIPLDVGAYLAAATAHDWCFVIAPDVIGDPVGTRASWLAYRDRHRRMVPVWGYGTDLEGLERYLGEAEVVAVGGLVPLMRERDERMLGALHGICVRHPKRLHLLGANWLQAITLLKDVVHSIDTSKWLDSARYGHVIFMNTRTGRLSQCHARHVQGYHEEDLSDRSTRMVLSARAMNAYCNEAR